MVKPAGDHSLPWPRGQHSSLQRTAWSLCRPCPTSVLCLPKTPQVSYAREGDAAPFQITCFAYVCGCPSNVKTIGKLFTKLSRRFVESLQNKLNCLLKAAGRRHQRRNGRRLDAGSRILVVRVLAQNNTGQVRVVN